MFVLKVKSHGKQNQIEGAKSEGKKVVVVEDLISTGGSSVTAVEALKEAGADVLGVVAIFTYGLKKQMIHSTKQNSVLYFK